MKGIKFIVYENGVEKNSTFTPWEKYHRKKTNKKINK
jgi:hypothetical protein